MSEKANNETIQVKEKSWFHNMKSEFKKLMWASKEEVVKQTLTVIAVSVVLGLIITGLDMLVKFGMTFLT